MLHLRDTLTGEKRELEPIADEVRLYVCGVTPYSEAHLGHALFSIVFDVLRRYLEWRGYAVRHIQNFTDIDDKLIERSHESGTPVEELAERYSDSYMAQLTRLNVLPATEYPRATEEIPNIIDFIERLVANGVAYESGGDVYYRVREKADYGKLSKRDVNDLRSGARVDLSELKDDPLDFALWKGAKPGEPHWDSPWGPGRPGWHIECSAMAVNALGEQIDIHGGGADLIFPHHENEIAQSESFTGKAPFAGFWLHNALLQLGEEKMSKSVGNIIGIDEVLDRYGTDALRMFIVTSHYRSPVTYSEEALDSARAGAERLRQAAFSKGVADGHSLDPAEARERFTEAMDDDLNTPRALAALFDLARAINRAHDRGHDASNAQATLRELAGVLGFTLHEPPHRDENAAPFVDLLVSLRWELRTAKQYELADRVRDGLVELGVELQDGPEGTEWSFR
jgi:cysteinyl-tRNA synthetase